MSTCGERVRFCGYRATVRPFVYKITTTVRRRGTGGRRFSASSVDTVGMTLVKPLTNVNSSLVKKALHIVTANVMTNLYVDKDLLKPVLFLLVCGVPAVLLHCFKIGFNCKLNGALVDGLSRKSLVGGLAVTVTVIKLVMVNTVMTVAITMAAPVTFGVGSATFSLRRALSDVFPYLLPVTIALKLCGLGGGRMDILIRIVNVVILNVILKTVKVLNWECSGEWVRGARREGCKVLFEC